MTTSTVAKPPNRAIRKYVSHSQEWKHADIASLLYQWADIFRKQFFPSNGHQGLPQPLVAVATMRVEVYAAYRLVPNPNGLPYEITMNAHYLDRPLYEVLESLLHEMVHLYQETTPGMQKCLHNYHNQEFVGLCEGFGLHPRLGSGAHWKPADGPFRILMEKHGIPVPKNVEVSPDEPRTPWWDILGPGPKKGRSTLLKFVCGCEPPRNSIRTGRKDLQAKCLVCNEMFEKEG